MTPDEIYAEWCRRLDRIVGQVQRMLVARVVWRGVIEMLTSNRDIPSSGFFARWFTDLYVSGQATALRRQADRDHKSDSLARLLELIENRPDVLTRARFVSHYRDTVIDEDTASATFDSWVAPEVDRVPPEIPRADLAALDQTLGRVHKFVDRRIAHDDRRPLRAVPTFDELDMAIDALESLTRRYNQIVAARDFPLMPEFQFDWEAAFTVPWVRPSSEDTR